MFGAVMVVTLALIMVYTLGVFSVLVAMCGPRHKPKVLWCVRHGT